MGFKWYRSLTDIAEAWAQDPRAPGDKDRLYQMLVVAVSDGAFFEDGLAVRAHALVRSMDPEGEGYAPFSKRAEIQPDGSVEAVAGDRLLDFETVYDRRVLHAYLGAPPDVLGDAALDPEVFFDWVKHTAPSGHGKAAHRLFAHVSINMRAFRNWCLASGHGFSGFVKDWPDSLPLDPNHRGPLPLPDADLITLCEAVTWLTTGMARPVPVLRRLMRRHRGSRWPRGLWRELEADADKLIASLRRGELIAYGRLDGGPHVAIPIDYFVSDVYAEFVDDFIGPDPLAWPSGLDLDKVPTYRAVRFRRNELCNAMRYAVRELENGGAGPLPTAAAGRRCREWLVELMRAGPQEAAKLRYQERAVERFRVSKRLFAVAWAQAQQEVRNPEWGRPGRRPGETSVDWSKGRPG